MTVKFDTKGARTRIEKATMRSVQEGAEAVRAEAIKLILETMKTGRTYWRKGIAHIASARGQPPASDTGYLVSSISTRYDVKKLKGVVEVGAVYGKFLEFGTAKMEPRPFLRPALRNVRKVIQQETKTNIEQAFK